jgi:hypothetical protein
MAKSVTVDNKPVGFIDVEIEKKEVAHEHEFYISQVFEFANISDKVVVLVSCKDMLCEKRFYAVGEEIECDD